MDAASTKNRAAPSKIAPPIAVTRSHPPQTPPASFQASSDLLPASSACRASTSKASPAPPISPACQSTSASLTTFGLPSPRETNRTGDTPPGARSSFPIAAHCPPANCSSRLKIICRSASTPRLPFFIVRHLPSIIFQQLPPISAVYGRSTAAPHARTIYPSILLLL